MNNRISVYIKYFYMNIYIYIFEGSWPTSLNVAPPLGVI